MADSVEGIVIEIESQSGAAISDLEALGSALESLKTKLSNNRAFKTFSKNYVEMVNTFNNTSMDVSKLESFNLLAQIVHGFTSKSVSPLKSFARNYTEAVNSINNGASFDTAKVENLRYFAESISQMKGLTISSTIAKQLDNIGFVTQNISPESFQNITELAKALAPLTQIKGTISKSFVDNFERLVELSQKMQGYDFAKLNEFTSALANMGSLANVDSSAVKGLSTSISKLSNNTRQASSRGRIFNTVLANIRTKTVAILMVTRRLSQYTMKAMTVYGNYVEALNLYKMALGGAAKAEYEFAEQAQNILGIDLTQWMQAQGVFSALASGFGVASDKAALMSRNLTQLAYDISSFYNISVEDAIQKVQSGFAGQIRPVRNLGYDLSQAKLEAIALANGIDKEVKSMTQAEKAQLRYVALMTQLTQVQGDLARTLDSPTNQMRLLNAQFDQMTRSIGMTLLPILNKVIPYLNAIFRVIKMIAEEIAALFGYTLPRITNGDWASTVTMGAEDLEEDLEDATGAAEKLKNTLASFDQINLITSKSGGSGSGGSASIGGSDLGIDLPSYDFLGDATINKAQEIADKMMKSLRPFVDWLKDAIKWTVDNIDTVAQVLTTLAVVTIGKNLLNNLLNVFGVAEKLQGIVSSLAFVTVGLQFSFLGGKDLANGDVLTGLIKSTIGAAALSYGGYLLLGPTGIVVGLGISIITTLIGWDKQNEKNWIDGMNDIAFSFRESRRSVEDFNTEWSKFIDKYSNPELDEKASTSKALKEDLEGITQSVTDLQQQYITGTISASAYAAGIMGMFKEMSEKIIEYNEAAGETIKTALQGELKIALLMSGVTMEEIDKLLESGKENLESTLEGLDNELTDLYNRWSTQDISDTEFSNGVDEVMKKMEDLGVDMGKAKEITDNFKETYSYGINFDSWDQMTETVQKVQQDYNNAMISMKMNHAEVLDAMNYQLKIAKDEDKARWQEIIEVTKTAMDQQEKDLTEGYKNVLDEIEETGYINWMDVYNVEGIEGAMAIYKNGVEDFNRALDNAFESTGEKRKENAMYYSGWLADLAASDEEMYRKTHHTVLEYIKRLGVTNKDWKGMVGDQEDTVDEYFRKIMEIYGYTTEEIDGHTRTVKKDLGDASDAFESYVNDHSYYASLYGKTTETMEKDTEEMANDIQVHFDRMGNIVAITSKTMEDDLSYSIAAIGTMIGNDAWTVQPMSANLDDLISVVDGEKDAFTNSFWGLMNSATYVLGDPTGMMQRSLFSALDIPELKLVGLGYDLGASIAEGIEESTPAVSAAAHHWAAEIAREWNIFGTEADKYFESLFENGMAAMNLLGVGNNVTSSVFNVKKARIRGYASGGFPDTADFFFANENGIPEYVGTMGGRTAVANNMEITKGVADGVYKAIKDTGLIGDVRKIASKDGKVVFAPSEEAGKVMSQSVGMYNGTGGRY